MAASVIRYLLKLSIVAYLCSCSVRQAQVSDLKLQKAKGDDASAAESAEEFISSNAAAVSQEAANSSEIDEIMSETSGFDEPVYPSHPTEAAEPTVSTLTQEIPMGVIAGQKSRDLHYNANLTLASSESKKFPQVSTIVTKADGKIMEQSSRHIVADIPISKLESVLEQITKTFKVSNRELKIIDFTAQIYDWKERRLALQNLVTKMQTLLQDPQTQSRDALTARIAEMKRRIAQIDEALARKSALISYSRLAVSVDANSTADSSDSSASYIDKYFDWIYQLGELKAVASQSDVKALAMKTPKGFAAVERSSQVNAFAAPNNIKIQAFVKPNAPQGTSVFWSKKVQKIWTGLGATVKIRKKGKFRVLNIESPGKSAEPVIVVAFRSRGKALDVIVAKAPNKAIYKDYETNILAAISSVGGKI